MLLTLFKKNLLFIAVIFVVAGCLTSCQKEISSTGIDIETEPTDLSKKITSSVSGFVTDENEVAVQGASVVFGNASASTDKFGYFEIRNQQVVQQAAVVSIIKPGYFKAVKTYIATANKSAFFRIKMLPKTIAGTVDAAAGGKVTLSSGLSVTLPAGAVVNAATGNLYTGTVSVAAQWLDPTATDLDRTMPGDLRGLNTDGALKLLQTYGMCAVELTGSSGELLQVANGKKATVNFPLPSAVAGNAPNSIPLWYFDEAKGLWKEEGSAVKSGNNYVGEVSHFSFWNCDVPANYVRFDCTVKDASGHPVANTTIKISVVGNTQNYRYGYTDSSGYAAGLVPDNSQLLLEVFSDFPCIVSLFSQNFTTANAGVSLGNIQIPTAVTANINGNVADCNNAVVTDGYVLMQYDFYYYRAVVKADGTFEFNNPICANNTPVSIIAVDNSSLQQSNPLTVNLKEGSNQIDKISACGTTVEEYINNAVDGSTFSLTPPGDFVVQGSDSAGISNLVYINGSSNSNSNSIQFSFSSIGIAVGSNQPLSNYYSTGSGETKVGQPGSPVINVKIIEYGAIGEFIAGTFSGTVKDFQNIDHTVNCNFRVRRVQ